MKCLLFLLLAFSFSAKSQGPFRFAFISDTHIGSPNGVSEEDLRRTVRDINLRTDLDFVVLTGDITELGTEKEIRLAKQILDSLDIPYYIIPGNHDTGWSESGGLDFTSIFGKDRFYFRHKGYHFIGCASGPYVRMSDGHIPRSHLNWMNDIVKKIGRDEPIIFLNHYPLDAGLDNWYEVIDLLKTKNTVLALCGHGHNNRKVEAEGIPSVMGRSNLRAKETEGGYNLVDVTADSILFTVRRPVSGNERKWNGVSLKHPDYATMKPFPRPDFSVNEKYGFREKLVYSSAASITSTPGVWKLGSLNAYAIVGNADGIVESINLSNGKRAFKFKTKGPIYSSPAISNNQIILGSSDGKIYCLSPKGKKVWSFTTRASVLGSPIINGDTVFIGGSDGSFRALDIFSGNLIWEFNGIKGAVTGKPLLHDSLVIFGAWDGNLYAINRRTGIKVWNWNNGSTVINYSPAACTPVAKDSMVFIVAPDRFLTAINTKTGNTLWRTKEVTVRESIGMGEGLIFVKSMQDTIAAFIPSAELQKPVYKKHIGYGYEHSPSSLIAAHGVVYISTKNGILYAVKPSTGEVQWAHKIDNSMMNTVLPLSDGGVIVSTMDGKVALLRPSAKLPDNPGN